MSHTQKVATDESPATAKKKASKGAPRPRGMRGRTINRRRDRALRKAMGKLEKAIETDPAEAAELKSSIAIIQAAQARKTAKLNHK